MWAKYCDQRVCMSVCLSARIYLKNLVQMSRSFVYMLLVAGFRSSDDSAMRYVLPVLWITARLVTPHGCE